MEELESPGHCRYHDLSVNAGSIWWFFYWDRYCFSRFSAADPSCHLFCLILKAVLGVQAGWCLLPAPGMVLCGRVGPWGVSVLRSLGTLPVLPQAIGMVSVAGEFKWKHVIERASKSFWKSGENFSLLNVVKVWDGMGWGEEAQITKCFPWPSRRRYCR